MRNKVVRAQEGIRIQEVIEKREARIYGKAHEKKVILSFGQQRKRLPEHCLTTTMDNAYFETYRQEFPVAENHIYLDHAGVSPLPLRVRLAVEAFLAEATADGAFSYPKWAQQVVDIRRSCARFINADVEEIAFIKNTSHGLSLVAEGLDWKLGDNVIIYEREFPSNLYCWQNLQRRGVQIRTIRSSEGGIRISDIDQLIDSRTRLLAVSAVQFSNGFRLDLERTGALCRQKNVLFCVDAIQSLGLLPMDVRRCNIDFLSADAHKWLLGPEGIGIFYCRSELCELLQPPLIGWKSVQRDMDFDHPEFQLKTNAQRFEEGSMNLMGIIGLGASLALLQEVGVDRIEQRVLDLGDLIIQEADKRGLSILTPRERARRGGNITITAKGDPAVLRDRLRQKRIMVNSRGGGLRISPHFYNTQDELLRLFDALDGADHV